MRDYPFTIFAVIFVALSVFVGISVNNHKREQCEHLGLGQWHSWTEVCEPKR